MQKLLLIILAQKQTQIKNLKLNYEHQDSLQFILDRNLEFDPIFDVNLQTQFQIGSQKNKCKFLIQISTGHMRLLIHHFPKASNFLSKILNVKNETPSKMGHNNTYNPSYLKDLDCYDWSNSSTYRQNKSDENMYMDQNLYFIKSTENELQYSNKEQYDMASDIITIGDFENSTEYENFENQIDNKNFSAPIVRWAKFFMLNSKFIGSFNPIRQYDGVFNLLDEQNYVKFMNNRDLSHNDLIELNMSNEDSHFKQDSNDQLFFDMNMHDKFGHQVNATQFKIITSDFTLNSQFVMDAPKIRLMTQTNFILLSEQRFIEFRDLLKTYLIKQLQVLSPPCQVKTFTHFQRKIIQCRTGIHINLQFRITQADRHYLIDFKDLLGEDRQGLTPIYVSTHAQNDDELTLEEKYIQRDMVMLGFKFWNKDAIVDRNMGQFGMSKDQQVVLASSNPIVWWIVIGLLLIVVGLLSTYFCYISIRKASQQSRKKLSSAEFNHSMDVHNFMMIKDSSIRLYDTVSSQSNQYSSVAIVIHDETCKKQENENYALINDSISESKNKLCNIGNQLEANLFKLDQIVN